MNILKGFLYMYLAKQLNSEVTKIGQNFTKYNLMNMNILKILLLKVVLLILYSNIRIIFKVIELIFGLKN